MSGSIKLAISTCPNDTFAFHGLLTNQVDLRGLQFETELLDIQQLNDGLFEGRFDIAKASFHAALRLADQMLVLPSGSALGFGVGPLLLAAKANRAPQLGAQDVTLCPGQHTTATLLLKLFYGDVSVQHRLFSEIMPALQTGEADFGVCIHEGRFTWEDQGLFLVEDLGSRWEKETESPLPLGGILASRKLDPETIAKVQEVIHDSIQLSLSAPESALPTMRKYAQEFDDSVLMKHVELYVNEWTVDLGDCGRRALEELSHRVKSIGLIDANWPPIEIYGQTSSRAETP